MQKLAENDHSLSLERKLKLHEARESIIGRLASNLPRSINLDSFLQVIVAELGQMMEVDRCDIIKITADGELRISQEWRATDCRCPDRAGSADQSHSLGSGLCVFTGRWLVSG